MLIDQRVFHSAPLLRHGRTIASMCRNKRLLRAIVPIIGFATIIPLRILRVAIDLGVARQNLSAH